MPASSNSHSERATLALRTLAEKDPCFASLTLFCHHRDRDRDEELAPAWTDGKTVFYGKAFEDWKQPQQVAVCAHEIMHVAFGHIPRGMELEFPRFCGRLSEMGSNLPFSATQREF